MNNKRSFSAALCVAIIIALFPGCTYTRYAARGDLNGIKKLIQEGKDINQHDSYGWTPLMWAVYYNHYETVKYMLENNADPNARTRENYGSFAKDSTPLMIASYYGHDNLVRLLLKNRADRKAQNSYDETALTMAEKYNHTYIMNMLEKGPDHRADRSVQNNDEPKKKFTEDDAFTSLIFMNDGTRIVGDVVAQTRTTLTVRTKHGTITVEKDNVVKIITK